MLDAAVGDIEELTGVAEWPSPVEGAERQL
jgi:hypothetical protein